ncbi:MAG TPA: DMT family transporter [Alphaproteobacteria bacterium]|nr:DMT family transporter [Alphaproteobacteria bacterium]
MVGTPANPPKLVNRHILGMLSVAAGVSVFSLHDAIMKFLSSTYAVHEIVFVRSVAALPFVLVATLLEGNGRVALHRPGLHIVRGLVMYASFTAYYLALARLPLAENTTLFFSAPLFVTVFAIPFLGEQVDRRTWFAIGVGFLGVLIVLRPGAALVDPAALLSVFSAGAYAVSALFVRRLGVTDGAGSMALSATAVYIVASGITALALAGIEPPADAHVSVRFLLRPWAWPDRVDFALFVACGLLAASGFFLIAHGYRLAHANRVAPFEYAALPWSVTWGYVFFGNLPDAATIIGALVILSGGLYMLHFAHVAPDTTRASPSTRP